MCSRNREKEVPMDRDWWAGMGNRSSGILREISLQCEKYYQDETLATCKMTKQRHQESKTKEKNSSLQAKSYHCRTFIKNNHILDYETSKWCF